MTKKATTRTPTRRVPALAAASAPGAEASGAVVAAARAAASVQLTDIGFVLVKAELFNPPAGQGASLAFDVEPCEGRWVRDNAELRVLLPYNVKLTVSADGRTEELARVSVTMRVAYRVLDPRIDDEILAGFAAVSPFMHTWPYLRSEVQQLTTKLGVPPLLLPAAVSGHAERIVRMARLEQRVGGGPRPRRRRKG